MEVRNDESNRKDQELSSNFKFLDDCPRGNNGLTSMSTNTKRSGSGLKWTPDTWGPWWPAIQPLRG